jgi:hypothetical protein
MAPAPSRSGLTPAQQRQRRSKIMAAVLGAVFLVVCVIQAPKLLGGHHPTTAETAAPSASSTPSVASPTAQLTPASGIGAAAPTDAVLPGQLTSFSHFAFKNPFKAQGTTSSGKSSTPAGTSRTSSGSSPGKTSGSQAKSGGSQTQGAPKKTTVKKPTKLKKSPKKKVKTVAFKPSPPNAAVISWNGKNQLVPVGVSFPAQKPLFKLVTLNTKMIHIGVLGGSFTSGGPTLAVKPGQKLTLANIATGTKYVVKLVKLVVATQAQLAAASPSSSAGTSTTGTTASSSSSSSSAPATTGSTTTTSTSGTSTTSTTTTGTTTGTTTTTQAGSLQGTQGSSIPGQKG